MRNPLLYVLRLVQFNRWFPPLSLLGVGLLLVISHIKFESAEAPVLLAQILKATLALSVEILFIFLLWPSYRIFTYLELLLKQKIAQPRVPLSGLSELAKLKKWLWIGFAFNFLVWLLRFVNLPQPPHSAIPWSVAQFSQVMDLLRWATFSSQKAMPIFYLVVLTSIVGLEEQNLKMNSELEEVV